MKKISITSTKKKLLKGLYLKYYNKFSSDFKMIHKETDSNNAIKTLNLNNAIKTLNFLFHI